MKRGILIGGGVLVIFVVGIAYYFYSNLGSIIQTAVETYGSEITQAEVKLDKVELDPASGKGTLRGFRVGNPQGFQTPTAFQLGAVSIHVDIGTITEDIVVIKEVIIDKPEITYELSGSGNNIDALQNNVNAYLAAHGLTSGSETKKEEGGPKLIIENLYIRGGTVSVSATILKGKSLTAPLPDIHLKDLGKEEGGASPGEVANKIMASISSGASSAVGSLGVGKTLDSLAQSLGGVTEGALKAVGDTTKSISEGIGSGVEKTGDAIKGLFK